MVLNFRDCGRKNSSDIFALIYVLFQLKTIFSKSLTLTVNVLLNAVLSNYEANTKRIANKVSDTNLKLLSNLLFLSFQFSKIGFVAPIRHMSLEGKSISLKFFVSLSEVNIQVNMILTHCMSSVLFYTH